MNFYTNFEHFIENPQHILDNSELLIPYDCVILDNVLYEKIDNPYYRYRFFYSTDSWDFIDDLPENKQILARLDSIFE